MSKSELVDTVVRCEWEDFSQVREGESVSGHLRRPETFARARSAVFATWSDELLESYLEDMQNARGCGRSLMAERFEWTMETVDPTRFSKVAMLPMLPYETCERIEHIIKFSLLWRVQALTLYPHVARDGRPLISEEDCSGTASYETYLRASLKTCSPRTVKLFDRHVMKSWVDGRNLAVEALDNLAAAYGYRDAADAEAHAA